MMPDHPPILVVGGGNMASAIILGAAAGGVLDPARCLVAEPDADKRAAFVRGFAGATEAFAAFEALEPTPGEGQVLLAVKPQMLGVVGAELAPLLSGGPERVVVSILAGASSEGVRAAIGGRARVVRVMPNTPVQAGRGMSAVCPGAGARPGDEAFITGLMGAVGEVVRLDESMMDAFTALSGSGPAYVYYLCEAMAAAGERVGFAPGDAARISRQVIAGAAALLLADERPPAALRAAVTSKGGTTAAAIGVLEAEGVSASIVRAIEAARDRGRELSSGR